MELDHVIKQRRSIRQFVNREVKDEDIHKMLEAAILAPSWKNSQVTRYYIVKNQDILERVKGTLPEYNYNNVKDAPVLIISTIVLNRSGFERDGTASNELENGWGYYDCGLHNMNLILKAEDLGLSTLVMGLRDSIRLKKLLSIQDNESIVSVIGLGYKDIQPLMPKRKTIEEITHFF